MPETRRRAVEDRPHQALEPRLSRIVLGAMERREGAARDRERLILEAIDAGLTTIDVAPLYGFGDTELLLGRALRRVRRSVLVATKVGLRWDADARGAPLFSTVDELGAPRVVRRDARPASVRRDVESSLRRLGVERLDLVQVHQPDPLTPVEETVGALLELRAEGKIDAIGFSNFDLPATRRAARALGDLPVGCLQLPFNLVDRSIEADVLPWARERRIPVLAYSPLAEGALAGKYVHRRPSSSAAGPWHHPRNVGPITSAVVEVARPIAERHQAPVAAVALAWVRRQEGVWPIVGLSLPRHLEAAKRALELELPPDEVEALSRAFAALNLDPRAGRRRRDRARRWPRALAGRVKRRLGRWVRGRVQS
jgi:aryl-alcohol dehydrogenase-like predicted oxidoreductase